MEAKETSMWRAVLDYINVAELASFEMWKAAVSEFVSTALLMFTLNASVIICLGSHFEEPKILVPLVVFVVLFLFLIITMPISGGHMNPIFSWIAAFRGFISLTRAAVYTVLQTAGSILGFLALKSVMRSQLQATFSLGGCSLGGAGVSTKTAFMVEFLSTTMVLFLAVTLAFDKLRWKQLGMPMVCMVMAASFAAAVFLSGSITGRAGYGGAGLNPARCLGAAVVHGGELWEGMWVFWVAPFFACLVYYAYAKTMPAAQFVAGDGENDLAALVRILGGKNAYGKLDVRGVNGSDNTGPVPVPGDKITPIE